nr:EOG090X0318 [Polyphemus pediculus]
MFDLLMPNVVPKKPETYFCTPIRIDSDTDYYITGFKPNATMETAHHMLLIGCEEPGSQEEVWNCGEMAVRDRLLKNSEPCKKGAQIIYAWAHDAPPLQLPKGVGFHVGGKSKIQYIVLQVHYASVDRFKDGKTTDNSGVFLQYTSTPQPKAAGVLLMGTAGRVPANSVEYMETACKIGEDKVIHPFAFRTHTHALGRVVSGYKVVRKNQKDEWTLIGKQDPQLPQMFYPVQENMTITKGDTVAARCTMVSNRNWVTKIGLTSDDEMCNFYIMYWTEGSEGLKTKHCYSRGPPLYSWSGWSINSFINPLNNVPEDASTL